MSCGHCNYPSVVFFRVRLFIAQLSPLRVLLQHQEIIMTQGLIYTHRSEVESLIRQIDAWAVLREMPYYISLDHRDRSSAKRQRPTFTPATRHIKDRSVNPENHLMSSMMHLCATP